MQATISGSSEGILAAGSATIVKTKRMNILLSYIPIHHQVRTHVYIMRTTLRFWFLLFFFFAAASDIQCLYDRLQLNLSTLEQWLSSSHIRLYVAVGHFYFYFH